MRSEQEMFDLILNTAREDERIRAVYMNGSRTNPNAPKDIFQDYDIVYVVRDTRPFIEDTAWIDRFGERLYMQYPERNDLFRGEVTDFENCYGWLMQFADGNRIDLHVQSIPFSQKSILNDRLCKIMLDKDGILPAMPEPTDADFWVREPTPALFAVECNGFWWCLNNVAKGLWREEIPYVQEMLNAEERQHLIQMLAWKIGLEHDFSVSIGKAGKYLSRFLTEADWNTFLSTYASAALSEMWSATVTMCRLFDRTACEVAQKLHYSYDEWEAENSFQYLLDVQRLPKGASAIDCFQKIEIKNSL